MVHMECMISMKPALANDVNESIAASPLSKVNEEKRADQVPLNERRNSIPIDATLK